MLEFSHEHAETNAAGRKLADYFRVPSIAHYLIVDADAPLIIHHQRREDGDILKTPSLTLPLSGGRNWRRFAPRRAAASSTPRPAPAFQGEGIGAALLPPPGRGRVGVGAKNLAT
jgi:hypothetical protein